MRVDEVFMEEVGLAEMPEAEKKAFMEHAQEEIEVRVGKRVGERLSNVELATFAEMNDDKVAAKWLKEHVPNYREIVRDVVEGFRKELLQERAAILP